MSEWFRISHCLGAIETRYTHLSICENKNKKGRFMLLNWVLRATYSYFSMTLESEKDIEKLQEIRYMRMYWKQDHMPKLQERAQ